MFASNKKNKGFSLIEIIITLGIIIMISTIILVNYPNLSETKYTDRAARIVSVKIREAQINAMSIKEDPTSATAIFPAYGIHFDLSTPKNIYLFVDLDCKETDKPKCKYDSALGDKIFETVVIPVNASIKYICGNKKSDPVNAVCNLDNADIVFLRPTPSIFLKGTLTSGVTNEYSDIEVILGEAKTGDNQKITGATQGGQIFVDPYP